MKSPFPTNPSPAFVRALQTDALLNQAWKSGMSLEETIIALTSSRAELHSLIMAHEKSGRVRPV